MRTISTVHSPEERTEMRQLGEYRTRQSQWRLVACVTILRTAVTRVLPLAGSAGWWVTLVCLVPGYLLYLLGYMGIKRGQVCNRLVYVMAVIALLADGISSMTALVTLFTQGVGAQGTQITLALVAAGMLVFCLNREGLARGICFFRVPLLAALAAVVIGYLMEAKLDHLFPLLGNGGSGIWPAFQAGVGMSWVFLLPLMEQTQYQPKVTEPLSVMLLCTGALASLCLWIPHEQLIAQYALGDCLVQTVQLGPLLRLVSICLWMAGLFLSLGSVCSLGAACALALSGRNLGWLGALFAFLLACTQLLPIREFWRALTWVESGLLLVFAIGVILIWGRKRK